MPRIDRTSSLRTARRSATRSAGSSARDAARARSQTVCRGRARAARRVGVEDDPSGDRSAPPRLAQDEPVADVEDERFGERDPDEGPLGRHLLDVVEADPRVAFGRAGVQLEGAARRDRVVERSDGLDPRLEHGRGRPHAGRGQDLAPRDARAFGGEVGRDPRDRRRGLDVPLVRLQTSDPRPGPRRQELDLRRPSARGPPVSVPVTTVPEPLIENTRSTCRRGRPPRSGSGAPASIASSAATSSSNPSPVVDEHATIGAPSRAVPRTRSVTSARTRSRRGGLDEIALGERDHRAVRAEDVDDLEVLLRLRLPPLVGRDDEQHEADGSDPGEHRADEPLVPRHVDEPELASRGERAPRVPELDREAPALLLVETIGVHPGQPLDQARLAVIDVAGGRDDGRSGVLRCAGRRGARAFSHRAGRRPRARSGRPGPGRASPRATPSGGRAARRVR